MDHSLRSGNCSAYGELSLRFPLTTDFLDRFGLVHYIDQPFLRHRRQQTTYGLSRCPYAFLHLASMLRLTIYYDLNATRVRLADADEGVVEAHPFNVGQFIVNPFLGTKPEVANVERDFPENLMFIRDRTENIGDPRYSKVLKLECHFFEFCRSRQVNQIYFIWSKSETKASAGDE